MATLANLDPTLLMDCFNTLTSCIKVTCDDYGGVQVVVVRGLEQLAMVAALGLFNAISYRLGTDLTPRVLGDLRRRYTKVFPEHTNFQGHRFHHSMSAIHCMFFQSRKHQAFLWNAYKPSANEYTMVSRNLVNLARFEYKRTPRGKVPCWILRFAFHSPPLGTIPPASVIADCLSIVAIDLGCDVPSTGAMTSDERYV